MVNIQAESLLPLCLGAKPDATHARKVCLEPVSKPRAQASLSNPKLPSSSLILQTVWARASEEGSLHHTAGPLEFPPERTQHGL